MVTVERLIKELQRMTKEDKDLMEWEVERVYGEHGIMLKDQRK